MQKIELGKNPIIWIGNKATINNKFVEILENFDIVINGFKIKGCGNLELSKEKAINFLKD